MDYFTQSTLRGSYF